MRLDNGKVLKTISDAVPVYKDEIWMNAFNKTVSLVDAQKFNEALEEINFAKSILEKSDNYLTSTLINLQLAQDSGDSNKKYEKAAKDNLNKALELDSNNYRALQIYGDLEFQVQNFELAREYYQKALSNTKNADNISELKQSLIYIHVELEEYDKAIILSDEVLESNPDNADIYFNVGVIYQRLGNTFYENMVSKYKSLTSSDKMTNEGIKNIYEDCKETLKMVNLAKDYFMDASMLEIDDNNVGQTESAINDMKRLRKNIKDVYLLSIEKIANDNNVILD
jgi:tetratricopeptide (TPR) repeat protein